MSDIKIVEGLLPWQVMRRANEGEAIWVVGDGRAIESGWSCNFPSCVWNWSSNTYYIIDTSTPEIDWDKFDWDFFNQYGGLMVVDGVGNSLRIMKNVSEYPNINHKDEVELRESPFYIWSGGKQPVPDMVEVIIEVCAGDKRWKMDSCAASTVNWENPQTIGFKLTGATR